jgi:hypothetical protein
VNFVDLVTCNGYRYVMGGMKSVKCKRESCLGVVLPRGDQMCGRRFGEI